MAEAELIKMTRLEAQNLGLEYVDETRMQFDFFCAERILRLRRSGVRIVACELETLDKTVYYRYPAESAQTVKIGDLDV